MRLTHQTSSGHKRLEEDNQQDSTRISLKYANLWYFLWKYLHGIIHDSIQELDMWHNGFQMSEKGTRGENEESRRTWAWSLLLALTPNSYKSTWPTVEHLREKRKKVKLCSTEATRQLIFICKQTILETGALLSAYMIKLIHIRQDDRIKSETCSIF